jgi:phosphoribosylformimino-5-aminoimidazole carboxamide ribotide isomerase
LKSPIVALNGFVIALLTLWITHGKFAPREPSRGFLISMISAPPSQAILASSTLIGLTSNFITTYLLLNLINTYIQYYMFRIVFVLDIFNGVVLHAAGGRRENYKPINTMSKICNNSNPIDIIKQLKPRETYIADLNRLQKTGTDNYEIISELSNYTVIMADTGIEEIQDIAWCLAIANTAVIGTETSNLNTIIKGADLYPGKINVSIDIKNGSLLTRDAALTNPLDLITVLNEVDINDIILLDLDRVGTNSGFNIILLEELSAQSNHDILVGGGVRSITDIETLDSIGVRGALVATAIHNGSIHEEILR